MALSGHPEMVRKVSYHNGLTYAANGEAAGLIARDFHV